MARTNYWKDGETIEVPKEKQIVIPNIESLDTKGLIFALRDHGVTHVGCTYYGGGDSGSIENWWLCGRGYTEELFEDAAEPGRDQGPFYDDDVDRAVEKAFEDKFYQHLNTVEDWWNNDGGEGTMVMSLDTFEFRNENNTHWTQTDTHNHSGKLDFAD